MIKIIFVGSIVFLPGCLYMVVHKDIMDFKMNDSTQIILKYTGGGATAPSYLQVIKKDLNHSTNTIIKNLDGFDDRYVFHFQKINDSILLFNIIDTALFVSGNKSIEFKLNINQVDTTFNRYKSH